MHCGSRNSVAAYSLIELLVVLVIVGVLTVVGVTMIGNRSSGGVRSVMDEMEGELLAARQLSVSTGRDVFIGTSGNWMDGTFVVAYRPDTIFDVGSLDAFAKNNPDAFHVAHSVGSVTPSREHMHAGIVTVSGTGSTWWAGAMSPSSNGKSNQDINTVAPFSDSSVTSAGFHGILTPEANLFQGGAGVTTARISGASKRFNTTFWVGVVGIRNGVAIPGGPMGLLVVQANGGTVYKFYNPGVENGGDGTWRRI